MELLIEEKNNIADAQQFVKFRGNIPGESWEQINNSVYKTILHPHQPHLHHGQKSNPRLASNIVKSISKPHKALSNHKPQSQVKAKSLEMAQKQVLRNRVRLSRWQSDLFDKVNGSFKKVPIHLKSQPKESVLVQKQVNKVPSNEKMMKKRRSMTGSLLKQKKLSIMIRKSPENPHADLKVYTKQNLKQVKKIHVAYESPPKGKQSKNCKGKKGVGSPPAGSLQIWSLQSQHKKINL